MFNPSLSSYLSSLILHPLRPAKTTPFIVLLCPIPNDYIACYLRDEADFFIAILCVLGSVQREPS